MYRNLSNRRHGPCGYQGPSRRPSYPLVFKDLRELIEYFRGKADRSAQVTVADCNAAARIVQPTIQSGSNATQIVVENNNGVINNFNLKIDSAEAAEAFLGAMQKKSELLEPKNRRVHNVKFVWSQASIEEAKSTGVRTPDRGLIEAVDILPHPILFAEKDADLKKEMIFSLENPFTVAFEIDADVIRIDNRIAAYRIRKIHNLFDRDDGTLAI